jgi:hypothetical protein
MKTMKKTVHPHSEKARQEKEAYSQIQADKQEYVKQQSIAFAEWLVRGNYTSYDYAKNEGMYHYKKYTDGDIGDPYSTEELYNLFLKSEKNV